MNDSKWRVGSEMELQNMSIFLEWVGDCVCECECRKLLVRALDFKRYLRVVL